MNILQKLSSIVKIENKFPKLKKFQAHFFSDNTSSKIEINDNKTINININVAKLETKEIEKISNLIKIAVQNEDFLAIDEKAKELVENFKKVDMEKVNKNLVDFFIGKISPADIEALRASIFVKYLYDQKQSIEKSKNDIVNRFGERGRNISNLYSAGYFTSLIKPLYEEMEKQMGFSVEKFVQRFNVIVTQYPFAVFVNIHMTKNEIEKEITGKMEINLKYGIHLMNIHGIGRDNVTKIQEVLAKLKNKFTSLPELDSGNNYINAVIHF